MYATPWIQKVNAEALKDQRFGLYNDKFQMPHQKIIVRRKASPYTEARVLQESALYKQKHGKPLKQVKIVTGRQVKYGLSTDGDDLLPIIKETKQIAVRNFPAEFQLLKGPLVWMEETLKETFVLEIHYYESEKAHAAKLPLNGWNSQLCFDYAAVANNLALQFCNEKCLIINNHLNSWPVFQAVVSVPEEVHLRQK